jgi:hypothetical protein
MGLELELGSNLCTSTRVAIRRQEPHYTALVEHPEGDSLARHACLLDPCRKAGAHFETKSKVVATLRGWITVEQR